MLEVLSDFYRATSIIDLTYLVLTILSLIKCYKKGFVLSILSMAKWVLAYVITLIIFPRLKPYFEDIIDNEYVLDLGLGITIFIIVIFLVLMINKGISKAVRYTGIGSLDTVFGFFFGFFFENANAHAPFMDAQLSVFFQTGWGGYLHTPKMTASK